MSIEAWRRAKARTNEAVAYSSLIGKTTNQSTLASREGEASTAGRLHSLEVKTQIHFQPYDGATNYHVCKDFDAALSRAVQENWDQLKDRAIAILRDAEKDCALEAEASVHSLLAEIQSAKVGGTP